MLVLLVERSIVREETAWCFWWMLLLLMMLLLLLPLVDITTSGGAVECPFTRGSSEMIEQGERMSILADVLRNQTWVIESAGASGAGCIGVLLHLRELLTLRTGSCLPSWPGVIKIQFQCHAILCAYMAGRCMFSPMFACVFIRVQCARRPVRLDWSGIGRCK